jgi:hypothetical protein
MSAGLLYFTFGYFKSAAGHDDLQEQVFSFDYPRMYVAQEYALGCSFLGTRKGDVLMPYIEVNRYQSDPDEKLPSSFDAFMKQQAGALCGADGPY